MEPGGLRDCNSATWSVIVCIFFKKMPKIINNNLSSWDVYGGKEESKERQTCGVYKFWKQHVRVGRDLGQLEFSKEKGTLHILLGAYIWGEPGVKEVT